MSSTRTSPITVALVDDHAMVRQALSSVLSDDETIEIVAHGGSRADALRIVAESTPRVLVLDYHLPDGTALEVLEALDRRGLETKALVLTVHGSSQYAVRALEAGAQGFLVKSSALDELREAIHRLDDDGIYITPSLSTAVLDELRRPKTRRVGLAALSTREFELLRLLGSGVGVKEAAARLNVTVSTASTYRARIMKKLNFSTIHELIRFALEQGLVE